MKINLLLSLLALTVGASLSFARSGTGPIAMDQWPSKNEICEYKGTANFDTKINVITNFSRTDSDMTVNAQVQFQGTKIGVTKVYKIEENVVFDAKTGAMMNFHRNYRESGCVIPGGECAIYQWDKITFDWGANVAANRMSTWRMEGDNKDKFAKRYPTFAKYWPTEMFGKPWMADFMGAAPDARRELDLNGFENNLVTPLVSSFFLSRYVEESKDKDFLLLVHMEKDGKDAAVTTPASISYELTKSGTVIKRSNIFLGDIHSPKDRPSAAEVDLATKQIKNIQFFVEHPYLGLINGQISPAGCK